ncbi:MAG TPA: efflux RND transporter periplasmic adaptor subunit [Beijerinckiaceae bacterium]|jgi:membrane fusion protein (multidrug efflux system)
MKRAFAFLLVFLLLGGLVAGLAWFQFVQKPEMIRGFIAAAPQPVPSVAVAEARRETWDPRIPAIGTFRAVQGVDIAPQVGGVIREIAFESGQEVKKGSLIAQIDDSVEQADIKANEASLRNAELALDRQRQLVGGGATTKANLDAALAARDSAAAAVERTRALISQKRLVAPFDGRIGLRRADVGQYVSPGAALVTLQRLDPMLIDFPLPEQRLGELKTGQTIEVEVDAYPGATFKGSIASIDARVSAETRNIVVRGEIENPERKLLPGMFGNVSVVAGEAREVVAAPRTAISFSLYGNAVFIVKPDEAKPGEGTLDRRFVRTGDTREDRIAILEGAQPGEQIVVEGQIRLQPGARVKISPEGATSSPPAALPKE